ncbi:unnamed protein product [Urochloa humidicola]
MEPRVFKAMLRFMYTDAVPEIGEHEAVAVAQGLLKPAHRYKMERLKAICEDMLCRRIDVDNVASTLVAADKLGCPALKDVCEEFLTVPGNLKAVMENAGFAKIKHSCSSVLIEYALTRLA